MNHTYQNRLNVAAAEQYFVAVALIMELEVIQALRNGAWLKLVMMRIPLWNPIWNKQKIEKYISYVLGTEFMYKKSCQFNKLVDLLEME